MLLELSTGAEATGSSYSDFKQLEVQFTSTLGGLLGTVMPSDDAEVFKMFLNWMVTSKGRALSLDTMFRTSGAVMAKTGRENLTKRKDVIAFYENLRQSQGAR